MPASPSGYVLSAACLAPGSLMTPHWPTNRIGSRDEAFVSRPTLKMSLKWCSKQILWNKKS